MFPAASKQLPVRTLRVILLLVVCHTTLIQCVTVNPHPDSSETTTLSSHRNWKSSFIRNNKEITFIPSSKDEEATRDDSPLRKTQVFGQRKQNLDSPEDLKSKRNNFLASLKSRNNTKLSLKESNKIDIILLPQDESDEVSTRASSYRRRYRKKNKVQQRDKQEEERDDGGRKDDSEVRKEMSKQSSNTSDDASSNRLFSKNKRRLFGHRYGSKVKETAKMGEKEVEEQKTEKKNDGDNVDKNDEKKQGDQSGEKKEDGRTDLDDATVKEGFKESAPMVEESAKYVKEKEIEKSNNLLQKFSVPVVSTLSTPIDIISSYPTSSYFESNPYSKLNPNGLSNMQLLHSLGMRKVRQPNHHKKRHQLESKSRSQYNMNSDSQMYIVKLPPQPYYYFNDKSTYNLKPKNNLPIKMVNNGKIDKVYHYNLPLVEKLMTGRKTYGTKVHKVHDPVQPYHGPYSHEYDLHKKYLGSKSDDQHSGFGYKAEASQEHKKVIPVHEDSVSVEELQSKRDYQSSSAELGMFNVNDRYKSFDPADGYNKFDAQEVYEKFNAKAEHGKFSPADEYKAIDVKYDFEKFNPSDSKLYDPDYKKATKPWNYHSKGSNYDGSIINIKPSQSFPSSPFDGNSISDKTFLGDKNFRTYDRVKSTSASPIYMRPYVHRYYTNNGRPKSIYVLPQYHKT